MTYVRTLANVGQQDLQWAGDKGARLGELARARFDVPTAVVLGAPAYALHINENQIPARIQSRLSEIEIQDPVELEMAAEDIRTWIEQSPIPLAVESEINSALRGLSGDSFAVRASRVIEDVVNPRASGIEQAFLGVRRDHIMEYVRKTWSTLWTSRAMYYRHRKKVTPERVTIAVILQNMVPSTSAGVLFTANPLTGSADQLHIDATFGLGEAIVAARWKPDHYVVRKSDRVTVERDIVNKPLEVAIASGGGIEVVAVADERQSLPCLLDQQILELANLGMRIEQLFKQAQDIEWCLYGDKIHLLQTRPLR